MLIIKHNYKCFKSAVAFFFLFFLHGFSIGTRQQGISYNICINETKKMNWTKEIKPNKEVPYNHIKCETPIGEYIIDWKGWKENPSYDISLKGEWIGYEYDLESAKLLAESHILEILEQIGEILN